MKLYAIQSKTASDQFYPEDSTPELFWFYADAVDKLGLIDIPSWWQVIEVELTIKEPAKEKP